MPTWTNPRTWVNGETVSHTQLNTHLRDNLDFLHSKDHVSVYSSTDEALGGSAYDKVDFDSEHFDSNSMWDGSTPSRVRCNSDGLYLVVFKVQFATNTTGNRRVQIRENAAGSSSGGTARGIWNGPALVGESTRIAGSRLLRLIDTDYVELFAYQDSGGSLDIEGGSSTTFLQLMQLAG